MILTANLQETEELTRLTLPDWVAERLTGVRLSPELSGLDRRIEAAVKNFNGTVGSLPDYDCPECRNRGEIAVNRGGVFKTCDCVCKIIRRNIAYIRESGLSELLDIYTFDRYIPEYGWQKYVKERAAEYVSEQSGHWLSVLGCVGAGKTHICTAVCGDLMKTSGLNLKYMLWRDESVKLKASVNDTEKYSGLIQPFKDAEVLYIDDLFKTKKDAELTPGDINLGFELINYRYNSPGKKTIISSEKSIDELYNIDSAIGTRIYEKSIKQDFCLEIENIQENNYRLR
jgi:DNA replication protein DnaC